VAAAAQAGWEPKRTIVFASWDAEEYGLVGSVEWGEDFAEALSASAIAYLNLDSAVTGSRFGAGGTPSMRELVRESIGRVPEPRQGGTVGEQWERRLHGEWAQKAPIVLEAPEEEFELHLGQLGSGSDYTVFLDHLGIPSINFGFGGKYGVYHSLYDNFRWMERYGDPGFVYHVAAARFYALVAMRLAAADVLPLRYESYGRALREQLDDLRRDVVRLGRKAAASGDAEGALDVDFATVLAALDDLGRAGDELDRAADAVVGRGDVEAARRMNSELLQVERALLSEDGLPDRPWFRNLIYAPGLTTGYAPWPFPELRQAIEDRDQELFARGSERVVAALGEMAGRLRAAAAAGGAS
jgi:N-acetylated-alpha-linked acidic dipeptidase